MLSVVPLNVRSLNRVIEFAEVNCHTCAAPTLTKFEQLRLVLYGPGTPCALPAGSIGDLTWFFEEKGKVELGKAKKEIEVWINTAPAYTPHALILEDKAGTVPYPRIRRRSGPVTRRR